MLYVSPCPRVCHHFNRTCVLTDFVRILQSFARISEDVRLVSSSNSVSRTLVHFVVSDAALSAPQIRIEMVKDPVVFGTITLPNTFFEFFSADEEPIDVIFTSQV